MLFTTLNFLLFLVLTFILYWTLFNKNVKNQNFFIFIISIFFYGFFNWKFLILLLISSLSTFTAGYFINKFNYENSKDSIFKRKAILSFSLLVNLGILFYFKYFNFFITSFIDISALFGFTASFNLVSIILPVGISFFTFTSLSYVFDVYNNKTKPTKDILAYLCYVTFFPSLLSGPISRSEFQLPQYLKIRFFNIDQAFDGCKMLIFGYFMKLCVADRLGLYVDTVYGNFENHNGTTLLLTAILYSIQIFADFGGYSLMGIGCGKLFGINLQTNFKRPYFALTITDFWRRWHMSLTNWFRDYLYFPLGGNRVSNYRVLINILIVFLVSGIWHGAAYNFIIWGLIHAILLIVEKKFYSKRNQHFNNKVSLINSIRFFITFSVVTIAWIFFRIETLDQSINIISKIFTSKGDLFVDKSVFVHAGISIIILFTCELFDELKNKKLDSQNQYNLITFIKYTALALFIILFGIFDGGQFIYFQF